MDQAEHVRSFAGCSEEFVSRLVASPARCALVDSMGVVRAASRTLEESVPGLVDQPVSATFRIAAADLATARHGPVEVHGIYANSSGELVPAILQTLYEVTDGDGVTRHPVGLV